MARVQHAPLLAALEAQQTLPMLSDVALRAAVTFAKWHSRYRTRSNLAQLDDHLLKDIGVDRQTAFREARRKFWQG